MQTYLTHESTILNHPIASGTMPRRLLLLLIVLLFGITTIDVRPVAAGPGGVSPLSGDVRVHDPSIIKVGSCYYAFSTGLGGGPGNGSVQIRKSCDFYNWTFIGTMFNAVPSWVTARLGSTPPNLWAPDINYFNGKYYLYYAGAIWGQASPTVVGLATATNIEGAWTDEGMVTDVNSPIDPHLVWDANGVPWLTTGGFNPGVYIRRIDPATGKFTSAYPTSTLITKGIENVNIVRNGSYYYLFGSIDGCCNGTSSTYKTIVGRSTNVTGPYVGENGTVLTSSKGTVILQRIANGPEIGPGGGDWFTDGSTTRFAYHFYNGSNGGLEELAIRQIRFGNSARTGATGWLDFTAPVALPVTSVNTSHWYNLSPQNSGSGKCVDVNGAATSDGTNVLQWYCAGSIAHQEWQFQATSGGYYRIVPRHATNKTLDVFEASTSDGALIKIWSYSGSGSNNQQWQPTSLGNGYFRLVARHSGKCLHMANTATLTQLTQQTCNGSSNQAFLLSRQP